MRDKVPEETRAYVGAHGFWRRGSTALFDIYIVNLDVRSNLWMMPKKALEKVGIGNKNKYLQSCLEHMRHFIPLVLSVNGIPGAEVQDAN